MELLPYPLSPAALRVQARRLQRRLQRTSLEALLADDLHQLYAWDTLHDPLQRRLCRNTTLIYSRHELQHALLAHYRRLLGRLPEGGPHG